MILAIDLGGTKTLVASINRKGEITEHIKFPTPKDYQEFISELAKSVESLTTKKFVQCVMAAPGKIDRASNTVIAFGNLPWKNTPLAQDVMQKIGIPVVIENDAKLAGLSEAILLKTYRKVLYITVSTGINGVLVIDGKIDPATQDAEYGQMLLEHEGRLTRWEKFASGSAIVARTGRRASEITEKSDWYIIARNIAIGLIDVIAATTPDAVVIGGGVGTHFEKFAAPLKNELTNYENDLIRVPPLFGAQRAEEAVIYGCYELAIQRL